MNYWLINPKKNGVGTNTSDLPNEFVHMGWGAEDCPRFYNEVQPGDVIIICEKSHEHNDCHFVGIAEKLDKSAQCWHLKYSTTNWNSQIEKCIRNAPEDFAGKKSSNPWGPNKSIISLGNNPAEMEIKQIIEKLIEEMETKKMQELLYRNYNIILHGAPGTGKTFKAKQIAKQLNAETKFVQFHPSYDYTDFVEGLRPIKDGNSVGFERKDGVFKAFCKKALKAYNETADKTNVPKYVFIIDEINRGDMSKIFGELFFSIDPGYRGTDGKVDTQYQNLIGMDSEDEFKDGFYIPENVYIIGTMNDIDRSVESMDFAMRRRFSFIEITAEESQSMLTKEAFKKVNAKNGDKDFDAIIKELKTRMNALNAQIVSSEIGLSHDYQIGAAYFLKFALYADQDKNQAYSSLWNNHLKSIITEYLRGTGDESVKLEKLKAAYDNGKTQNN